MPSKTLDLTKTLTLLVLLTLAVLLLAIRPNQSAIETLIPYETAITLPAKGLIAKLNPMPNSPYGPFPSDNPNAMSQ